MKKKLVIEIDKKAFDYIMGCSFVEDEAIVLNQSLEDRIKTLMFFDVLNAIKNGTPLPKGHGRLIDKDKMMGDLLTVDSQYHDLIDWCLQVIEAQPTIIEADEGGE